MKKSEMDCCKQSWNILAQFSHFCLLHNSFVAVLSFCWEYCTFHVQSNAIVKRISVVGYNKSVFDFKLLIRKCKLIFRSFRVNILMEYCCRLGVKLP